VTSCATVYVMSFFVLGVAADFRYAYWCVLGTLAGAVAAVLAAIGSERNVMSLTGTQSRPSSPAFWQATQ
jgi:hypothetical protein